MSAGLRANPSPLRVLFVDPDHNGVEALIRAVPIVTSIGIVPSAQAALGILRVNMPQLLVTELALADTSGIELIRYVHQTPATQHLLLMVVTSRSTVAEKVAAFQAGADDYLVKPVDPDFFALRVRLLMGFARLFPH